ncbi:MAG TPA: hypothetical protein VNM48_17360 [Chloroflexota bacterium]|nr:hypothetical protein [Chloroflexota bacterium]
MDLLQLLRRLLGRIFPPPPALPEDEEPAAEVKLSSVCPAILRVAITTERQVKYHGYAMVGADGELVPGSFVITGMSPEGS